MNLEVLEDATVCDFMRNSFSMALLFAFPTTHECRMSREYKFCVFSWWQICFSRWEEFRSASVWVYEAEIYVRTQSSRNNQLTKTTHFVKCAEQKTPQLINFWTLWLLIKQEKYVRTFVKVSFELKFLIVPLIVLLVTFVEAAVADTVVAFLTFDSGTRRKNKN